MVRRYRDGRGTTPWAAISEVPDELGVGGQCRASWEGKVAGEGSEERKMVMARRGDGGRRCAGVLEMVMVIREKAE